MVALIQSEVLPITPNVGDTRILDLRLVHHTRDILPLHKRAPGSPGQRRLVCDDEERSALEKGAEGGSSRRDMTSLQISCDGTFKSCPPLFRQNYGIHVKRGNYGSVL
ncbi:hypothetical protein FOZ63_006253 [Perkinsus olseni]|uniref:Uncharacterized protein n=1 Tax=Perkinsus olseni TaxID=32597 RepID=A0A7J6S4T6_PEROL|nr:hypothetical protein FOZ63_006253 [Perkinsus olseni]